MASWLKRAEDLFEVVDRRAKLVVSELADEETNVQLPVPSASNGQGAQSKRKKAKSKVQKHASTTELPKLNDDTERESVDRQLALPDSKSGEVSTSESDGAVPVAPKIQTSNDKQNNADNDASVMDNSSIEKLSHDHRTAKPGSDQSEAVAPMTNLEYTASFSNSELNTPENFLPSVEKDPLPASQALSIEPLQNDNAADAGPEVKPEGIDGPLKPDQEKVLPLKAETPMVATNDEKRFSEAAEAPVNITKQLNQNISSDQNNEQEQLEEAQGLLKSTTATGQSKEARLARVCAGLSSRLQEYKSENAQLEELLTAERELSKSYEDHVKQLQGELSSTKVEVARVETSMAEALAAKNSEIEALVNSLDVLKKQAAMSEGNLVSLQANMEALMRNRELSETRMTQALREELASAERRAEDERAAHNSTKMTAMEREVELERRAVDASTALARVQRIADERTTKAAELEQRVALLEVECASLNQELQDMEARVRRGQKKPPEDTNQLIQKMIDTAIRGAINVSLEATIDVPLEITEAATMAMQAWQEEVERARQGQRDAESKLSSLEAELQKMRVEMAAMKRDAEHYSRQEHMELEKRYRDLTDLLYYKQTQLETMASEKAAAEFQLEKEIKRLQETQAEAERTRVPRRASSYWEEDTDMKDLEPLPLHQRHLVGATTQLRKAAKFLDTGAVRATRFLWRYPTARVILLCYLVFVHLFLMYLLHRLQEQADNFSAQEVAKSMGLSQPNLP